ncbi:hypothetical protein D3C86_1325060 [compost metagenome]
MIIKRVQGQIPANPNLAGKCAAGSDPVKVTAEGLRRIGFALCSGRNRQDELVPVQENQRRRHAGIEREPDVAWLRNRDDKPVSLAIFCAIDQQSFILRSGFRQNISRRIDDLECELHRHFLN